MTGLTPFQRACYRTFRGSAEAVAARNHRLRRALERAHVDMRPGAYMALAIGSSLLAALLGLVMIVLHLVLAPLLLDQSPLNVVLGVLAVTPFLFASLVYGGFRYLPQFWADERARKIDLVLPYALNFIAAMSTAGVRPAEVFGRLARQESYHEVAREFRRIDRDIQILGKDLITAVQDAIDRSPSIRLQDFLQGTIASLRAGSNLRTYFLAKSEQYMEENRHQLRQDLEKLGLIAESYITVVVAAPLFLIIIFSVFSLLSSGAVERTRMLMYGVIFVLLPLSHAVYLLVIQGSVKQQ